MPDPIAGLFEQVRRRAYEPRLAPYEGTLRFEINDDHQVDHWFVKIKHGALVIAHEERPADVVVGIGRPLLSRLIEGREDLVATWVRGEIELTGGDPQLFFVFWQIPHMIPGPPDANDPRTLVQRRRKHS